MEDCLGATSRYGMSTRVFSAEDLELAKTAEWVGLRADSAHRQRG